MSFWKLSKIQFWSHFPALKFCAKSSKIVQIYLNLSESQFYKSNLPIQRCRKKDFDRSFQIFLRIGHVNQNHATSSKRGRLERFTTYRVSQLRLFFSNPHCSYKNYPILKISSLLGRQWIDFYVGIIYNKISSFQ